MPAPPRASSPRFQCRALAGDVSDKLRGSLPCQEGQGVLKPASPRAPLQASVLPARLGTEPGETPWHGGLATPRGVWQPDPHRGRGLSSPGCSQLCWGSPCTLWSHPGDPPRCRGLAHTQCAPGPTRASWAPAAATLAGRAAPSAGAPHGSPHGSPHGYPTGTQGSAHPIDTPQLTPQVPLGMAHPMSTPQLAPQVPQGSAHPPQPTWPVLLTDASHPMEPLQSIRPVQTSTNQA